MKETTTHLSDYITYEGVDYEYHATDHGDRRGLEIDSIDPHPSDEIFDKLEEMALEHATGQLAAAPQPEQKFKIWSIEHGMWWKPNGWGYTPSKDEAGIYSQERALEICNNANIVLGDVPNEAMVPVGKEW